MSLTVANQVCLQEQKEKNLIGKPVGMKKQTTNEKLHETEKTKRTRYNLKKKLDMTAFMV